jgi:hypothetical protein
MTCYLSLKEMIEESKIFGKNKTATEELFKDAFECLLFIISMKSSELIHVLSLDDEENELDEGDIECAILKTFINCNLTNRYSRIKIIRFVNFTCVIKLKNTITTII